MSHSSSPNGLESGLEHTHLVQHLIDAIPSPVFQLDSDGRHVGCNKAFEAFFGIACERLAGKTPPEAFEQHMHGTIRVDNSADGARFTLDLPSNLITDRKP